VNLGKFTPPNPSLTGDSMLQQQVPQPQLVCCKRLLEGVVAWPAAAAHLGRPLDDLATAVAAELRSLDGSLTTPLAEATGSGSTSSGVAWAAAWQLRCWSSW
jgi:hypothetical protein